MASRITTVTTNDGVRTVTISNPNPVSTVSSCGDRSVSISTAATARVVTVTANGARGPAGPSGSQGPIGSAGQALPFRLYSPTFNSYVSSASIALSGSGYVSSSWSPYTGSGIVSSWDLGDTLHVWSKLYVNQIDLYGLSGLLTNIKADSSGIQLSGSFSGSFFGDGSNLTGITAAGTISSSAQIADDISGSFVEPSSSLANRISVFEGSGIISASSQVDHDATTNFVSGEHFLQSAITTLGTVTSGNVNAILPDGIISGSTQFPSGLISSSGQFQTSTDPFTGSFSGSFYGDGSNLTGVGSALPSGVVSASAQIDHNATTNFVSGEHFLQSAITTVGTVTTGNVDAILPSGLLSSSLQLPSGLLSGSAQISGEISGAFARPNTEVVYGTGTSVSSSGLLTFNDDIYIARVDSKITGSLEVSGGFLAHASSEEITFSNISGSVVALFRIQDDTSTDMAWSHPAHGNRTWEILEVAGTWWTRMRATDGFGAGSSVQLTTNQLIISVSPLSAGTSALTLNGSKGVFTSTSDFLGTPAAGIEYESDYSTAATTRSLVDLAHIRTLISGSVSLPSTEVAYGTGTYISSSGDFTFDGSTVNITNDLTVGGTITAQEFHTEFVSSSVLLTSGSTRFGNSADDTHMFTGSVFVNGSELTLRGDTSQLQVQTDGYTTDAFTNPFTIVGNNSNIGLVTGAVPPSLWVTNRRSSSPSLARIGFNAADGAVVGYFIADGFGEDTDDDALPSAGVGIVANSNHPLMFLANNKEGMRVAASGFVGFGSTAPQYKLDVHGDINATGSLIASGSTSYFSSSIYQIDENIDVDTGAGYETISIVSTASYDGAFFDYIVVSASNRRAGSVMSIWDESGNIQFTDNSTLDIGSTTGVNFSVEATGSDIYLKAETPSNNWRIKTITRAL